MQPQRIILTLRDFDVLILIHIFKVRHYCD